MVKRKDAYFPELPINWPLLKKSIFAFPTFGCRVEEYEDGYLDTRARELFDVIYKQSPCSFYFRFLRLLRNGGEIQIEPPLPPSADFAVGSFRTIDNALYKVTKRTSKEEENPLSCLMDKEITITLTEQRYK